MVRSKWLKSLIVALASTGMSWGQQPAVERPAAPARSERIMNVAEAGKPAQKCKVLKAWRMADSTQAYEVKSLDSGEVMTIVENGPASPSGVAPPGSRLRAMATEIFHWGRDGARHPEAPVPPEVLVAAPTVQPPASATPAPQPSALEYRPFASTAQPPSAWPAAHGEGSPTALAASPPKAPGAPMASKALSGPPPVSPMLGMSGKDALPLPPKSAPVKVVQEPVQIIVEPAPNAKPPREPLIRWPILRSSTDPVVQVLPAEPAGKTVAGGKAASLPSVAPAQPSDWRQSWGKTDGPKPPVVAKVEAPRMEVVKPPPALELPSADSKRPDPLRDPMAFSRPLPDKDVGVKSDMVKVVSPPILPMPAPSPVKDMPSTVKRESEQWQLPPPGSASAPPPVVPPVDATMVESGPKPGAPLGSGSVLAAGDPKYVPVPIVTVPDIRRLPEPPNPQMPKAPQPNQGPMLNAFTPAPVPSPPMDPAATAAMANAFTPEQSAGMPMPMMPPPQMARGMMPPAVQPMMPGPMAPAVVPASGGMPATQPQAGAQKAIPPSNQPLVAMLRDSVYPSHREWAADKLALLDAKSNPQAVQALAAAAREDPAATVRAGCVRSLVKMNVCTPAVLEALRALKGDADATVQREAEQALTVLAGQPKADEAVKPAGAIVPK